MPARRATWVLIAVQAIVVAAYLHGTVAYLVTDAAFFPEQAPPAWALPAVLATAGGFLVAVPCALLALPLLTWPGYRAGNRRWPLLAAASAANLMMLLVMATPPGWELFDWYVS
jgi:hypothetical protein